MQTINIQLVLTALIFILTVLFIMWRPYGVNETIPTAIGSSLILLLGVVSFADVVIIGEIISGASITILSTIVMSIVLESIGFFRWIAFNIVQKAKGSGITLFWYTNLLCFLMTLFVNNDGSILITTPIIIHIVTILKLKISEKIPYLISGALMATAASAPIGISNLANLIALKIVGLNLNTYAAMMFVPSMAGIITIALLLFLYFRKDLPIKILTLPKTNQTLQKLTDWKKGRNLLRNHPLAESPSSPQYDWWMFRTCLAIVVLTRGGFFVASGYGISIELVGIAGALLLIGLRWYRNGTGVYDIVKKTPWHILIFAFSMYVIVYGLRNVGLTSVIIEQLRDLVTSNTLNASLTMGLLLTVMSNICNNLPAVMIGTLALTEMQLDTHTLQVAYLANVLGADIGALITPMGTLATLIWMFILRRSNISITWGQYLKVTILVIPIGLLISLISLYLWTEWLF